MKQQTAILLIFISLLFGSCVINYTYFEGGRPRSIEENNARRIVANNWNLILIYESNTDDETIKKINHHNDSISAIIKKEKGDNWVETFIAESRKELMLHVSMRATISQMEVFRNAKDQLFEPIILFEKKGKKYLAHIVGQQKTDETRTFITFAQILISSKDNSTKIKSEKITPLTIQFSENGVN